jgi:D-3-phosphoglycerate dehydrogenase
VFVDEPLKEGNKLVELDNLVMTPHLGASTVEAQEKVSVDIAENVIMYLRDNMISNAINAPRGQLGPEIVQYLPLAERLGIFVHQLNGRRPVDKIEVVCSGEIARHNTKMVTLSAIIGVMKNIVGDTVNMVNAESIARSKNIKVTESKNEDSPVYSNMVTVTMTSGKDVLTVRGTVFAQTPRLIGVDNYCFEIPMDTNLLFGKYNDMPGMIGSVGNILGENGINIGQMTVGREKMNKTAIMLMGVDYEVSAEVVKRISDVTGFNETKFIRLVE